MICHLQGTGIKGKKMWAFGEFGHRSCCRTFGNGRTNGSENRCVEPVRCQCRSVDPFRRGTFYDYAFRLAGVTVRTSEFDNGSSNACCASWMIQVTSDLRRSWRSVRVISLSWSESWSAPVSSPVKSWMFHIRMLKVDRRNAQDDLVIVRKRIDFPSSSLGHKPAM